MSGTSSVAEQFGSGLSGEALEQLAVNTIRTHLARIFSKTQTARQADLIKLVASLALPVAAAAPP